MENNLPTTQITPEVLSLADDIRKEIDDGKERAINAMEQEKRNTYWNVGKHIKEHLMLNEGKEDYGTYTIANLSKELSVSKTLLYDSVHLYEEYPDIVHTREQLTWSHMRVLVKVPEKETRQVFEEKVVEDKLSVRDLKDLVKKEKAREQGIEDAEQEDEAVEQLPQRQFLKVERGQPYTYRLQNKQGKTMVDLGFRTYVNSPTVNAAEDEIVQVKNWEQKTGLTKMVKGEVPYYTYKAYVIEVIDGDTIWVDIDLGFNTWTTQKLRLKGVNAKDITTEEGQSAKQYIQDCLDQCEFIVVKTYWRDKFTRYLADIFFMEAEKDIAVVAEEGTYLNQELLDEGLADNY